MEDQFCECGNPSGVEKTMYPPLCGDCGKSKFAFADGEKYPCFDLYTARVSMARAQRDNAPLRVIRMLEQAIKWYSYDSYSMYSSAKFKLVDGIWYSTCWEELKKGDIVKFFAGYKCPIDFNKVEVCILTEDPKQNEDGLWSVVTERVS
jgi:hypothetical protein